RNQRRLAVKFEGVDDHLFSAGLQSGTGLIKSWLHVHHTKLPVILLPMRCHRPQESNAMTGSGNVWMIPTRHEHCVAFTHDGREFGLLSVGVDKLNSKSWLGHLDVDIHLFEHRRMFMRGPACPVARLGDGESGYNPSRLNILANQDIQIARSRWSA